MSIFKGLFLSRDKPKGALGGSRYSFFFGGTSAGKAVNEHTAMQMTAVYSCVRMLSETLAGLPLHVYKYNDSGGKEKDLKHRHRGIRSEILRQRSRSRRCAGTSRHH